LDDTDLSAVIGYGLKQTGKRNFSDLARDIMIRKVYCIPIQK